MKKLLKVLGIILTIFIIGVLGILAFLQLGFPKVSPAKELNIEYTSERIERGKYLAHHVTLCMDCHAERDFGQFAGPPKAGTLGKGGDVFDHQMGFPGVFYAKNITPTGISDYTDGELFRVITTGVDNEGEPIFPVMPYQYYGKMDPEDIYDIIAYIRSLPAQGSEIPESKADFPVNFIIRSVPKDGEPTKRPDPSDQIAYGSYLVNAAGCAECHTPVDAQGAIIPELSFTGGRSFVMPGGTLLSSNITPHENGLGGWTEDYFVQMFKQYEDSSYVNPPVAPGDYNTIMPWTMYAGMKESDLSAIYAYIMTLAPSPNSVTKWTAGAVAEN
ncbi:c-type cytochrome [Algoriphagus sediminis]|uniref:C-type cytochrome n=1 Tax=Algoriphagus sediminis TaxID=3057113 RepID=A0ABT7YH97_9BACT|nr:c-type cytochrome [Algoriphagus sediminis]MDN3205906.1 c-type cytochrome [Algoriphagus sediminis]